MYNDSRSTIPIARVLTMVPWLQWGLLWLERLQRSFQSWPLPGKIAKKQCHIPGILWSYYTRRGVFISVNTLLGTWCAATDLAFSRYLSKNHQKQFAFSWQDQQYTFTTVLPQGCFCSPALCLKGSWYLCLPPNTTLICCMNNGRAGGSNHFGLAGNTS